MSNAGELKIGGQTIIKGCGPVHTVTTFQDSHISGFIRYCVTNSVCCVEISITPTITGIMLVHNDMPYSKIGGVGNAYSNYGTCYIPADGSNNKNLYINAVVANVPFSTSFSYPVADNWNE